MSWPCFVIEPADRCQQALRRYKSAEQSEGEHLCQAMTRIEDGALVVGEQGTYRGARDNWPRDDPRWPTACATCGYVFGEDDIWQLFIERLFVAPAGAEYTLRDAPAGAMWRSPWMEPHWAGPDGQSWSVMLPPGAGVGHSWCIDGPSSSGGSWTRTGTPPLVTARPSILTPAYHGWLTDGVLSDDLDGRSY